MMCRVQFFSDQAFMLLLYSSVACTSSHLQEKMLKSHHYGIFLKTKIAIFEYILGR